MVDAFRERKLGLLAQTETKLKRNGEVSCCRMNGIIVGVQEIEKGREDGAILMNDEWQSAMIDF